MDFRPVVQVLNTVRENGPAGNSLSVCINGERVFSYCGGLADKDDGRPLRGDAIFRICSETKLFTAVAVLQLFERGALRMNDPLERFLPEFAVPRVYAADGSVRPAARSVTIKDLMTMTSGYPYYWTDNATGRALNAAMAELEKKGSFTVRDFAAAAAEIPLCCEPGAQFNYGVGFDILAAVIEVISGESYADYLRAHIFDPLGMSDTGFFITDANRARVAALYTRESGSLTPNRNFDRLHEPEHRFTEAGSGALSTLDDMDRFLNMLLNGGTLGAVRILGRKTVDYLRVNHLDAAQLRSFQDSSHTGWDFFGGFGYGLGVRVLLDKGQCNYNGSGGEFGWAGAAGTFAIVDPAERLTINYMQQLRPNPDEKVVYPLVRNAVYGCL